MKELRNVIWLTLAAFGFRIFLYFLFANEVVISPDPMDMCFHGNQFASGNYYGVLSTYWTPAYPVLIGIFTLITNSSLQSAIIISIISGCLIVPLTYYLVKQSFGHQAAIIAGVIAIFFPHLVNSMFSLGTENIYLLWITGALILGWNGFSKDSTKAYFFVGILIGLAYLTRPEAFGYLSFFIVFIFCNSLWQKKLPIRWNSAKQIFVLFFSFSLLAAPYILYLKHETGIWTISGKIQANTIIGDFENSDSSAETENTDPDKPGFKTFIKYFGLNLIQVQKSLSFLVPTFLFLVVGLGLFGSPWDKERLQRESYLILFCIITILGYAAAVVQDRYFYVLLPIFFGWIANGIVQLKNWFQASIQNFQPNKLLEKNYQNSIIVICLIIVFIYVLPISFFLRTSDKAWEETQYEERDAGLWLKENGKPSALVFSAVRRPVFYSGQKHLPYTKKSFEELLQQFNEQKVEYVITSERSLKRNPTLEGFTEFLEKSSDFDLIYENKNNPKYKISIFRVK